MKVHDLTQRLKARAAELGFNTVGIVPAVPSARLAAYMAWITAERHGTMGYLARPDRIIRRQDLNVIVPGVQSLVCVGRDYFTQPLPPEIAADPSRGRISNYAWQTDYHDSMTPNLQALADWLAAEIGPVQQKVYVDTGAILERSHAEAAGLGFTGKNTMLIRPRQGSFFFLGELLTTTYLEPDTPEPMPSCGRCRKCLDACPTDAFPAPYVLDARRCISYLTIELKGAIPRELRPLMGNWVYGCDICQDVCPFNRFALDTADPLFAAPDWETAAPPLLDLLQLSAAQFNERYANSPIKRIKRPRLLRNAAVAAGNWGSRAAVPALINLLDEPDGMVRGHAAWALGQIDDAQGYAALHNQLSHETEAAVREEIQLALLDINLL